MLPPEALEARVAGFRHAGFSYECRVTPCARAQTEPVVLLGGFIQDKDSWRLHELMLSEWATIVAIDLPGSGNSDPLPPHHGIGFLAEALHHALDSLDLATVNVVGYSYGALTAYQFAHSYPGRAARLALAGMARPDPNGSMPADILILDQLLQEGRWDDFARKAAAVLTHNDTLPRARKADAVEMLLTRQLRSLPQDRVNKYLQHVERLRYAYEHYGAFTTAELTGAPLDVPALAFTGESDLITPPRLIRQFARSCLNARFTTIKESGHMVMLERAVEFTDLLHHFFTDTPLEGIPYCNTIEYATAGRE